VADQPIAIPKIGENMRVPLSLEVNPSLTRAAEQDGDRRQDVDEISAQSDPWYNVELNAAPTPADHKIG
jgi:hypothetical protein